MNLLRRLRLNQRLTQAALAELMSVTQPAIAAYESGRRSPNLDAVEKISLRLGRRVALVPSSVAPSHDRSELFSRLLHQRVAEHFVADPSRVRRHGTSWLAQQASTAPGHYDEQWAELLRPENEVDLLVTLCVPDAETTGLLSSSPFAGLLSENERLELLERSSAA